MYLNRHNKTAPITHPFKRCPPTNAVIEHPFRDHSRLNDAHYTISHRRKAVKADGLTSRLMQTSILYSFQITPPNNRNRNGCLKDTPPSTFIAKEPRRKELIYFSYMLFFFIVNFRRVPILT